MLSISKENIIFTIKIIAALMMLYSSHHTGRIYQKGVHEERFKTHDEQLKTLGQIIQVLSGDCIKP